MYRWPYVNALIGILERLPKARFAGRKLLLEWLAARDGNQPESVIRITCRRPLLGLALYGNGA